LGWVFFSLSLLARVLYVCWYTSVEFWALFQWLTHAFFFPFALPIPNYILEHLIVVFLALLLSFWSAFPPWSLLVDRLFLRLGEFFVLLLNPE